MQSRKAPQRQVDPTPEEIAERSAAIRATWSAKETILRKRGVQRRGVHREEPYEREIGVDELGNAIEPVHLAMLPM